MIVNLNLDRLLYMDAPPTVEPNLARAAAFFTLWRTAILTTQPIIQVMVKQYAKHTPEIFTALEEVAQIYARMRHHDKQSIPIEQRVFIEAKDISIFVAMTQNCTYARALAFVTLWRDGDLTLRGELEQLIRSEVGAVPSFRRELDQAVTQVEQYTMPHRNEHVFLQL